jgi:AbrB family looped-hinge helix DNA binding protein
MTSYAGKPGEMPLTEQQTRLACPIDTCSEGQKGRDHGRAPIDGYARGSYTGGNAMTTATTTGRREDMARVKLGSRHQITIPAETIKRLGLTTGEELELVESEKGIVLIPLKYIPKDQQWYYTDEWQRMMQEAFQAVKEGRMLGPFESVEEFKQAIKERARARL